MKVGDYVRTKEGFIARVIEIYEGNIECDAPIKTLYEEKYNCLWDKEKENIIKSSPNIIDLIEVGDYVNGCRVIGIDLLPTKQKIVVVGYGYDCDEISENNIKSIVTKEQFEEMEYKL